MSVVSSSRVSSVSSILKNTGVRSQLIKQSNKVYFKLPKDVKHILHNFQNGSEIREYENLIQLLRDGSIKDSNLAEFLADISQYVASLNTRHELFIDALLRIDWINRSPEVISNYKRFLLDLICVQPCHMETVIHHLVQLFKPDKILTSPEKDKTDAKLQVGEFKNEDMERMNHVHDVLYKILKLVPMSDEYVLRSLESQFPFMVHDSYVHQLYIYALLKIMEYAPKQKSDILLLIINKLTALDVNIPHEKIQDEDEEEDDYTNETANGDDSSTINNDTDKAEAISPVARTLDACMELLLKYMHEFCFANGVLQIESLKILYVNILRTFEAMILTAHACRYVQYIAFYICSFKPIVAEMFVDWLWRKASNPNVSAVLRQSAVCYISSLCANASFVTHGLVKLTISKMINWINDYIGRHEYSNYEEHMYVEHDVKAHIVFHSVCQAFFHLFNARHKEFVTSKHGILFLEELDIPKIVNCKLNPLKICNTQIVHNFAEITNTYQLAYCYTIIENNERNELPIFGMTSHLSTLLSNVFPYESYTLQHSGQRIVSLLRYNVTDTNQYRSTSRHC